MKSRGKECVVNFYIAQAESCSPPRVPLVATKEREEGNFNYKSSLLILGIYLWKYNISERRALHNLPCNYFIMAGIILTRVNNNSPTRARSRTAQKRVHARETFFHTASSAACSLLINCRVYTLPIVFLTAPAFHAALKFQLANCGYQSKIIYRFNK